MCACFQERSGVKIPPHSWCTHFSASKIPLIPLILLKLLVMLSMWILHQPYCRREDLFFWLPSSFWRHLGSCIPLAKHPQDDVSGAECYGCISNGRLRVGKRNGRPLRNLKVRGGYYSIKRCPVRISRIYYPCSSWRCILRCHCGFLTSEIEVNERDLLGLGKPRQEMRSRHATLWSLDPVIRVNPWASHRRASSERGDIHPPLLW